MLQYCVDLHGHFNSSKLRVAASGIVVAAKGTDDSVSIKLIVLLSLLFCVLLLRRRLRCLFLFFLFSVVLL